MSAKKRPRDIFLVNTYIVQKHVMNGTSNNLNDQIGITKNLKISVFN